jgi:hypothetical protein
MTRFIKRLACIGGVSALVVGLPATGVAQAAHRPAGAGELAARPIRPIGAGNHPGGVRDLSAV